MVFRLFGGVVRTFLALLLFPAFTHISYAQSTREVDLATRITDHVVGNGTAGPYQLKGHFILEGTERIRKDNLLLEVDQDYSIDYNHGTITFFFPLSPADTLLVDYEKLKFNLRRKYFHRELVYQVAQSQPDGLDLYGEKSFSRSEGQRWSFFPQSSSSDLMFTGSKTFSIEVGSAQDLTLRQGLWLSAKGNATKNTEVSLQLSDQNMPATTEGSTKRLEELDKVQVLIKSPHFSGTLGDYYLTSSGYGLFSYEKKLKGFMAEATTGKNSTTFALASFQGENFTNKFTGEEGKQGPYLLQGKNKETSIMILPGTERVWVDGEKMERGSDNDYTIDYALGTIQFTPRRLITSDSRITVDFEYSIENYERDFYNGSLSANLLGGKMELKTMGIHQADDRGHPSSFALSPEDKVVISQAGNDRFSASRDGASFMGEGMGDYNLAYDSLGNPYYQYGGSDSGSYKVSFSRVGEKEGSYRYTGGGVYQYVYPGNGEYLPLVFLPLPQSHSLFDLNLSLTPVEALKTEVEWAKSKKDDNSFSPKDDEHNWGDALSLKSAYQNADFQFLTSNFHRLKLQAEYRMLSKDFVPFGRMDVVEKESKWNLPEGSFSADEKTYQVSGIISPLDFLSVDFDVGKLEVEKNFTSSRKSLEAEISLTGWFMLKGKNEKIKSQELVTEELNRKGEWTRNLLSINNDFKRISTSLSWEQERKISFASDSMEERINFDQFSGKISLAPSGTIKTSTQLAYREDDVFRADHPANSFSYTWSSQISLREFKEMLSSDLEFAHRVKKYRHSSGENNRQNLLISRIDFFPPSQIINLKLYHSQNQIHSSQRWDSYMEVEEGRGEYRYQDGEYIPDPEGNFVRISEWVGETRPSLELSKSIRVIFSPQKVSPRGGEKSAWSQVGRLFSTDSFIDLQGRFLDNRPLSFYLFYPLIDLPEESILLQKSTIRHDVYILPTLRSVSFRFRWEKTEDEDRLLSGLGRRERRLKEALLLKSHVSARHSVESQMERERIKEEGENETKNLIRGGSLMVGFTRKQAQVLELKIAAEYKKRDEQTKDINVRFFSLWPEFILSLLSQGRLSARFVWTHLRALPENKRLSYVLTEGKRRGENYEWQSLFDYQLNQHLTWSAAYSGESVPDGKTKHSARMELKVLF